MARSRTIPLPKQWPEHVKSGVLHAISLASVALSYARGRATGRARLRAELDQAHCEIAMLREELSIKDARWNRSRTRRRPHYSPTERMRILALRAGRGWTIVKTARVFLLDELTLMNWMRRIDEGGEAALVQTVKPVNRFPDYVRNLVRQLKAVLPTMSDERIARILARLGLFLGKTTIRRIVREGAGPRDEPTGGMAPRRAVAKGPGEVWHLDLTSVPIRAGLWVPWHPLSLPQRWPFCWCVAVVVDQWSRMMIGFAVFRKTPNSRQIQQFLERAARRCGHVPRRIVTDRGRQFDCRSFKTWCKSHDIRVRYGVLGEPSSICIVERFIRSLKDECTRRLITPMTHQALRSELEAYAIWYNQFRPHANLDGRTPQEAFENRPAPRRLFETRPKWPHAAGLARHRLALDIRYVQGRKHLPVIELRRAA